MTQEINNLYSNIEIKLSELISIFYLQLEAGDKTDDSHILLLMLVKESLLDNNLQFISNVTLYTNNIVNLINS